MPHAIWDHCDKVTDHTSSEISSIHYCIQYIVIILVFKFQDISLVPQLKRFVLYLYSVLKGSVCEAKWSWQTRFKWGGQDSISSWTLAGLIIMQIMLCIAGPRIRPSRAGFEPWVRGSCNVKNVECGVYTQDALYTPYINKLCVSMSTVLYLQLSRLQCIVILQFYPCQLLLILTEWNLI